MPTGNAARRRESGFTFVAVLVMLAALMLGMAAAGPIWSHEVKRERELELLRLGALHAQALAAYRAMSPGSLARYPDELEQLTRDTRFIGVVRHIRRLYPDPMQPGTPWALVRDAQGQIIGVYSRSNDVPLNRAPLDLGGVVLPAASRYSDWKFIAPTASTVNASS